PARNVRCCGRSPRLRTRAFTGAPKLSSDDGPPSGFPKRRTPMLRRPLRSRDGRAAAPAPTTRPSHSPRRRFRPLVEGLEGRWAPATVTSLADGGPGSLREAIALTPPGGTGDFQSGLTGTITLTAGQLTLDKDLTLAGPGADVLTVSGNRASRVFEITPAVTVALSGLRIANGTGPSPGGGGIYNAGVLTVTGSTLSSNSA